MAPVLRLYEDVLANDGSELALSAAPHIVYVVHGSILIADRPVHRDEGFGGDAATQIKGGPEGATVWRWELAAENSPPTTAAGSSAISHEKLSARLDTLPNGPLLLRGDSVAFPPGGCAYLHRHQGPGIRCLLEGGIRIDTHGHSTSYGPGSPWYESGPEPVFAQATDQPTRFIRVLILPMAYLARSSVEYLREEDKDKPRTQKYKIYADMPIAFAAATG
ncbi:MAG: hypothetical protein ACLPX7_24790 [Xanthobacteraceae bacterium]